MSGMKAIERFSIEWVDGGRVAVCPANPFHPDGVVIDATGGQPCLSCEVSLPYPAKRCGHYVIRCLTCNYSAVVTTAGRADDPHSIKVPCKETRQ